MDVQIGPAIGMKEAQNRLRNKLCLNCGQPQTNVELNSCNKPACRKILRPLYHWAKRVCLHLKDSEPTYFNHLAG